MPEERVGKSFISTGMAPTLPGPMGSSGAKSETRMETGEDTLPIDYRGIFFEIARQAIGAKVITRAEVEIIYRPGSRKENYWTRHVRDLVSVLADRGYQATFPDLESGP